MHTAASVFSLASKKNSRIFDDQFDKIADYIKHATETGGRTKLPDTDTLKDPQKFFAWFGGVPHPKKRNDDGFPIIVTELADYQYRFALMKRGVMLKTNKAGVTTSEAITGDFRTRLLPESAGFDCLLVGQNQFMADQHLLDLKRAILQSETARPFMITNPQTVGLREEKSKMRMLYVLNPYNPTKPSRIISIGFSEALAYSWKNVNSLHISDPGQINRTQQLQFFSALYSRLSNTEGDIKIEGVAGEKRGYFWDLCRKLFKIDDAMEDERDILDPERQQELDIEDTANIASSFEKMIVTADDAIRAEIMTREWLEYMRTILPPEEFMRIYYCKFAQPEGAIFGDFKIGEHEPLGLD
jgi:hypothetical protein